MEKVRVFVYGKNVEVIVKGKPSKKREFYVPLKKVVLRKQFLKEGLKNA